MFDYYSDGLQVLTLLLYTLNDSSLCLRISKSLMQNGHFGKRIGALLQHVCQGINVTIGNSSSRVQKK